MNVKPSYLNFENGNENLSYFLKKETKICKQYVIIRPVFQNNNTIGYLAFDENLGSNVIVREFFPRKFISRDINGLIKIPNDFEQTFDLLKTNFLYVYTNLKKFRISSHIIKIFSVFKENNTIYSIEEIPKGLTLQQFLSRNYGELSWVNSKNLFLNLIKFLNDLHNYNIIHCSLNPSSLLVYQNELKIVDFSNALFNLNKQIQPVKLHDGYFALEQYNDHNLGKFTDVYSIAAIIYKSLTGTKPVSSASRVLNDNLLPPHVLNSNIPKNVSVSIMSALVLSSKLRTQTMHDFYCDLNANSRDFYTERLTSIPSKNFDDQNEIIEVFNENKNKNASEMKTRSIIFIAMIISTSIVLFTVAIVIFALFQNSFFNI